VRLLPQRARLRDVETALDFSEHGPSFRPGDEIEKFWDIVQFGEEPSPILQRNLARDPHWMDDRFGRTAWSTWSGASTTR
jgi:hypothetical protein